MKYFYKKNRPKVKVSEENYNKSYIAQEF